MANKWLAHVKSTMRMMKKKGTYKKGLGLKQVIAEAKKSYKKHHGGGDSEMEDDKPMPVDAPVAGRRRRTGRTRRHRR
jgi:hypothetical protein